MADTNSIFAKIEKSVAQNIRRFAGLPPAAPDSPQANKPSDDPFAGQPKVIADNVRRMVDELYASGAALDKSYQAIDRRASEGLRITGQDFLGPEHVFNEAQENWTKLNKLKAIYDKPSVRFVEKMIGIPPLAPELNSYEVKKALSSSNMLPYKPASMEPLDAAFEREYLKNAPSKNVTLDSATHDEAGLIAELLKKNPGIALGDLHISAAQENLLLRNMAVLKANHVDTIYAEHPLAKQFNHLSVAELRQLARDGHYKDIKFSDAKSNARYYGFEHSDNVHQAFVNMMATAKENGIQVVYMDKEGPAREREALSRKMLAHRGASDNFIWTDFIKQDRKGKAPENKYIVWGGLDHFVQSPDGKGMVSQALGIPLLAYQKSDKATNAAFFKVNDPNGVDFYLPGGNDYPDDKMLLPSPSVPLRLPFIPWLRLTTGIKDASDTNSNPSGFPSGPLWKPLQSDLAFDSKDVKTNTLFVPHPTAPSLKSDKDIIKR